MNDRAILTFISPRFLFPTDSGGKIRTSQILRGLMGGVFRVRLVMPSSAADRELYGRQISSVCDELVTWERPPINNLLESAKKVAWLMSDTPVPVRSDWDRDGSETVRRALAQRADVVVFDFPHSAILSPKHISSPSVMFTHNIEAEIFHRHWEVARFPPYKWIWRNQYKKMKRFEERVLSQFDTVVAVSDRDCQFFRSDYQIDHCQVIPTGVDTDFFHYVPPQEGSRHVVFCGSMDWMANVDGIEYFFERVWPLIRSEAPGATMKVVGRAPPVHLVNRIRDVSPEWEFTGFVDDVREHICGAAAFVIPLRVGGGTRIKAFEAMAMGTPVVSTTIGIEGLPVADGKHFLGADDPKVFAGKVLKLFSDTGLSRSISETARQLVEQQYGYRRAATVFENICLETISRRR